MLGETGFRILGSITVATVLFVGAYDMVSTSQVIVPPQPRDRVTVLVQAETAFDSASGLFTYSYELASDLTSEQNVGFFAIEFDSEVLNPVAPLGWSSFLHVDRPIVSWAATDIGTLPPDYVDDGNLVPSPFAVAPGTSLAGFSFQSVDSPATATFYVQGEAPLPQVSGDADELAEAGLEILDFTENSFVGTTVSPRAPGDNVFLGGRRPAVDGFLGFVGIEDRETLFAPIAIVVRFSVNGETVDATTFSATLNGEDVTPLFVPHGNPNELRAVFEISSSPLEIDRNTLLTSVEGIVPDTSRTAADVDRLVLFVR